MPNSRIIELPDGFNGHTVKFFSAPIEIEGDLVKLRCAEPGKGYLIAWKHKREVANAY